MLIRKFRSTSPSKVQPARRGFTLLELAISMGIMSVILGILVTAFLGSRKAQGQAVSMMGLKVAGSSAIGKMYLELSQAKRLLASLDSAPATEDIGRSYFSQMEIPVVGLDPILAPNLRFPRMAPDGSFIALGTAPGQLAPAMVGNTLVFVTRAPEIKLATPGVLMKYGSLGLLRPLTAEKPFRLGRFRFVAYYLAEEMLPDAAANINGTMRHTMNLVRWESQQYVDKADIENLLRQVPAAVQHQLVWDDLVKTYQVYGAWDSTATDATQALFTYNAAAPVAEPLVPLAGSIRRAMVKPVTSLHLEPYARGMVAFNTNDNFKPLDSLRSSGTSVTLQVPMFGEAGQVIPYGFEVGIVGTNSARAVLLRLSLAARLNQGGKIFGWSHQQIVQMMDN